MPQFLRAIVLALTMLIAHVASVLPHGGQHAHRHHLLRPDPRAALAAVMRIRHVEAFIAAAEEPPVKLTVVPTAARLPVTGPAGYSGSIAQIIQQAFAPLGSAAVSWAERVALCESGDNPYARNPDGAAGLFQFMPSTWATTPYAASSVYDPAANARAAAWLYARRGPGAWSCS